MADTQRIQQWRRFEWSGQAQGSYHNPVADLRVTARVTGPDGSERVVPGFWDGGHTWRLRFSPSLVGAWRIRLVTEPADAGLHGQESAFECVAASGENPLFRHGPVGVRHGERFLRHADGTPFFWAGDTAWNGVLKSTPADWTAYLADRSAKHFNVIQFVMTHWLASAGNADGRRAYIGSNPIEIDPAFFHWMDQRVDMLNEAGFLGAGVMGWSALWNKAGLDLSPGSSLSNAELVRLNHYLLARYQAHHMAWILAGDGLYEGAEAERWREIGRDTFRDTSVLATIHPGGHLWVEDAFRNEKWFSFHGYQSGHTKSPEAIRWITSGALSHGWRREPGLPMINLEFCYEGHHDFGNGGVFTDVDIRRDGYASVLAGVPAGITYGVHGVWSWETIAQTPMCHSNTGVAPPWSEAIHRPGGDSMKVLFAFFKSLEWWRLEPCPALLASQPGDQAPLEFVSAARSPERDLAVIYTPTAQPVRIHTANLAPGLEVTVLDARTGARLSSGGGSHSTEALTIELSGDGDRLILFSRPAQSHKA